MKPLPSLHTHSLQKLQNAKMQCVDIVIVSGFCLCISLQKGGNGAFWGGVSVGVAVLVCEFFSTEEQKNIWVLAGTLMKLMYLCLVSFLLWLLAVSFWPFAHFVVMLNLLQHLSAEKDERWLAVRSWNKLFAFAHRKHLLFFWIRYGQDDVGGVFAASPMANG